MPVAELVVFPLNAILIEFKIGTGVDKVPLPEALKVPVAIVRPSSSVKTMSSELGGVVPKRTPNPHKKAPLIGQEVEGIEASAESAVNVAYFFSIMPNCPDVVPKDFVKLVHDPAIGDLLCYIM